MLNKVLLLIGISFILFTTQPFAIAATIEDDIVNIENSTITKYLSDNTYDKYKSSGTKIGVNLDTVSVAPKYRTTSYKDSPVGYLINWTNKHATSDIQSILLTVGQSRDLKSNSIQYTISNTATSYTLYNMVPGFTYYYKIEEILKNSNTIEIKNGSFHVLGQVRMLRIEGVNNIRDIGGWETQFGFHIRYGRIFRSAALEGITSKGRKELVTNLKVTAELDLRGSGYSCSLGSGAKYTAFASQDYLSGLQRDDIMKIYAQEFKWLLSRLKEGRNVCFHCSWGRDRTGTFAFLIEGVLGVAPKDIYRDYEITSFVRNFNNSERAIISYHTFSQMIPYIRTFGPSSDLAKCFANYFIKCGVPQKDIDEFRSIMLDIPDESVLQSKILGGDSKSSQSTDLNDDGSVNVADIFYLKKLTK